MTDRIDSSPAARPTTPPPQRALPPFRPHPWLTNEHAQTIAGAYLPGAAYRYRAVRHTLRLEDGEQVVLHEDTPPGWSPGDRVALLIHGLGGSFRSSYMVRIAGKLNDRGVRVYRMDLRGCGAGYLLAHKPGHAACSPDVAEALIWLKHHCQDSPVSLIGFSMGGNIVLKLAAEAADNDLGRLDSVFAAAPPIDCHACAEHLERVSNRIYCRSYVRWLIRNVRKRRKLSAEWTRLPLLPLPRSIREFDDRFTAPLSGFSGVEQYYTVASTRERLVEIRLPTTIIAAADDPVVPIRIIEQAPLSATVALHVTEAGGHLGYLAKTGVDPDRRWLDWRVVDWVLEQGLRGRRAD